MNGGALPNHTETRDKGAPKRAVSKVGLSRSPRRIKYPVIPAMTYVMTLIRNARWEPRDGSPFHDVRGMGATRVARDAGLCYLPTLFGRVTNGVSSGCMVYAEWYLQIIRGHGSSWPHRKTDAPPVAELTPGQSDCRGDPTRNRHISGMNANPPRLRDGPSAIEPRYRDPGSTG